MLAQNKTLDPQKRVWQAVDEFAQGLLRSRGISSELIETIMRDLQPRIADIPKYTPGDMAFSADDRELSLAERKKVIDDQAAKFLTEIYDYIDTLVGFFVVKMLELELELKVQSGREIRAGAN